MRMDKEKVLTWLEICGENDDCSGCCPYGDKGQTSDCRSKLMADALAMLKERDTGSVGIRQTSDSIEFTASGDAQQGFGLGIIIGKMTMLEYIWKNCLWGNVMTDGVLDILKRARKI